MRRRNLLAGSAALATLGTTGLARPAIAQGASAKVLRFVPQADLANPDPIWTTATVATNHGYMVWDTLYGIDDALIGKPQMCAGHEVSSDELTWTFTLRDGLKFTDGEPVRGIDCTTSIARWAVKNPFGQQLAAQTDEMKPLDDKRFQIRLKKRFRQMTYALGSQRLLHHAGADGEDAGERADQGIHRLRSVHLQARRMGVRREGSLREERGLRAAAGEAGVFLRRQGGEFRARGVDRAARSRHRGRGVADRRGRLAGIPACSTCCRCCASRRVRCGALRSARLAGDHRVQSPVSAVRQSEAAARAAAGDRSEGIRHRLGRRAGRSGHLSGRLLHRPLADGERCGHGRPSPRRAISRRRRSWWRRAATRARRS